MQVVVSGVSGRFPGCVSLDEFAANLFDKQELNSSTEGRYPTNGIFQGLPNRIGRLKDFELFDEEFFKISPNLAKIMDAQARKSLEVTVEAILDAGLKLEQLQNTNRVGIFFASIHSDIDRHLRPSDLNDREAKNYSDPKTAFYKQIFGEWISYCLNIQGSYAHYESACSSAMYAFTDAFQAIKNGHLDIAIVCTTNLNMAPKLIFQYLNLGILSKTGYCRVFDEKADGYVKSEAAVCFVLQAFDENKKNLPCVNRIYAKIMNARCNSDGFKKQGITFPRVYMQEKLIRETYKEINLSPIDTNYVEAHGTGTQVGDIQEMICIDKIFNDEETYGKRKKQLYVGSVKSNIGHSESSSGLCSIAKCLIAFNTNKIPPMVLFEKPNPKISSLITGKIKPVLDTIPLNTECISLSSFGFGGSNSHVILKNGCLFEFKNINKLEQYQQEEKVFENSLNGFYLINFASRTQQGLYDAFKKLATVFRYGELNLKEVFLFNDIVKIQSKIGFNYFGHMILNLNDKDEEEIIQTNDYPNSDLNLINYINQNVKQHKKKLFYVLPGLGCQWNGMATSLIKIPFFNDRLKELCNFVNSKLSFDLYNAMIGKKEKDQELFNLNDSIYCLIAVAIFQICYFDLLKSIEIYPDGYLGHSFGELLCFYLEEKCSAEQILLATLVVCNLEELEEKKNIKIHKGSMAVIGLGWQQTLDEIRLSKCENVDAGCNNSIDCVTVSGCAEDVDKFLEYLTKKKIFNRKIASCDMAFHCRLVNNYYNYLLTEFNQIFKSKIKCSSKFISTSEDPFGQKPWVLSNQQEEISNKEIMIGEYFTNCILKPVLFKEACEKMIKDAEYLKEHVIVLEISPRNFLTSLMKSNTSKYKHVLYLSSFKPIKDLECKQQLNQNLVTFLNILGNLFENGFNPNLNKLNKAAINSKPNIKNNLSISSLVKWNHQQNYALPCYPDYFNTSSNETKLDTILNEYDKIKQSQLTFDLPISLCLHLTVKHFLQLNKDIEPELKTFSFFDINIFQTIEFDSRLLNEITINFMKTSDNSSRGQIYKFFFTLEKNQILMEGNFIFLSSNKKSIANLEQINEKLVVLKKEDFYFELKSKNYLFANNLKCVEEIKHNKNYCICNIEVDNWLEELECLIQVWFYENKVCPRIITQKSTIQISELNINLIQENHKHQALVFDKLINIGQTTNIQLSGVKFNEIQENPINKCELLEGYNNKDCIFGRKFNHQNVTIVEKNSKSGVRIGLIEKNNNINFLTYFNGNAKGLGYLCLPYGYLISMHLLKKQSKFQTKSVLIDCENNLPLVLGFCNLLKQESNCNIYVNLDDERKRHFIPDSDQIHILSKTKVQSTDLNILKLTEGEGVQLVITSAETKQRFQEAINCLSSNGKFIHINNTLSTLNFALGMSIFLKNIDFVGITLENLDLNEIVHSNNEKTIKKLFDSIDDSLIKKLSNLEQNDLQDIFGMEILVN